MDAPRAGAVRVDAAAQDGSTAAEPPAHTRTHTPVQASAGASVPAGARVLRHGMLLKQGYVVKSWKERLFVLYDDRIAYYAPEDVSQSSTHTPPHTVPHTDGAGATGGAVTQAGGSVALDLNTLPRALGVIMLTDVTGVAPLRNRCSFTIRVGANATLHTRDRDFMLLAPSDAERRAWVEAISRALLTPSHAVQLLSRAQEMRRTGILCTRALEVVKSCISTGIDTDQQRAIAVMESATAVPTDERGSDVLEGLMLDFRLARSEAELLAVMEGLKERLETEDASTSVRDRLVDTAMAQYSCSGEEEPARGPRWTPAVQSAFALVLHAIATRGTSGGDESEQGDVAREAVIDDSFDVPSSMTAAPATSAPTEATSQGTTADPLAEFREDARFEDDFTLGSKIGEGAYSVVHRAVHKATGEHVAVKIATKARLSAVETRRLVDEVCIMAQLDHEHIVRLRAFYEDMRAFYIVTELMLGGELFDRIVTRSVYSEREARDVVRVLAEALQYMHTRGIAHRDIKPENILLSSPEESRAIIKIADMGFAKRLGPTGLGTSCGTPSYVAPDILLGKRYGLEVDMWSLGVITYILLCGYAPFAASNQTDLFRAIVAGRFYFDAPYWDRVSSDAKDLIRHLLVTDPTQRYTASQVLAHRWFHGTVSSVELSSALLQMRLFQQSRRHVIKRGELIKQGRFVRSLKRRVFVLTSDTIEYYDPVDAAQASLTTQVAAAVATEPSVTVSSRNLQALQPDAAAVPSPRLQPITPRLTPSMAPPLPTTLGASALGVASAGGDPPQIIGLASGTRPKGIITLKDVRAVLPVDSVTVLGDLASAIGLGISYVTGSASSGTAGASAAAGRRQSGTPASDTTDSRRSPGADSGSGEFWFKVVTVSGREYLLCADTDAARSDWIRTINGALGTGDLMRKAAMAMQGERLSDAVALMKLAREWQDMMRGKAEAHGAGETWLPGIATTDSDHRRSTRISSKVTAAMAAAAGGATTSGAGNGKAIVRSASPRRAALMARSPSLVETDTAEEGSETQQLPSEAPENVVSVVADREIAPNEGAGAQAQEPPVPAARADAPAPDRPALQAAPAAISVPKDEAGAPSAPGSASTPTSGAARRRGWMQAATPSGGPQ